MYKPEMKIKNIVYVQTGKNKHPEKPSHAACICEFQMCRQQTALGTLVFIDNPVCQGIRQRILCSPP